MYALVHRTRPRVPVVVLGRVLTGPRRSVLWRHFRALTGWTTPEGGSRGFRAVPMSPEVSSPGAPAEGGR